MFCKSGQMVESHYFYNNGCSISFATDLHNKKKTTETRKNVCTEYI